MGTRNVIWAQRQRAGGPLHKLLFLHICETIPEHGSDPHLETTRARLADYCEAPLWRIDATLSDLVQAQLIRSALVDRDRLSIRIPFPQT